jgi:hypothetical protein
MHEARVQENEGGQMHLHEELEINILGFWCGPVGLLVAASGLQINTLPRETDAQIQVVISPLRAF